MKRSVAVAALPLLQFLSANRPHLPFVLLPQSSLPAAAVSQLRATDVACVSCAVLSRTLERDADFEAGQARVARQVDLLFRGFCKQLARESRLLLVSLTPPDFLYLLTVDAVCFVRDCQLNHALPEAKLPPLPPFEADRGLRHFVPKDLANTIESAVDGMLVGQTQEDKVSLFFESMKVTVGWLSNIGMDGVGGGPLFFVVAKRVKRKGKMLKIALNFNEDVEETDKRAEAAEESG